jgi:hypothetical protein
MPSRLKHSRVLLLGVGLLAGCGKDEPTAPRTLAGETPVTATIVSIADVPLFSGDGPDVRAQVTVRNVTNTSVTILPCSNFIEARLPSSRTWTNIGLARIGLCATADIPLAPGASAVVGASGSSTEFRALAGADARVVLIRAGFVIKAGAEDTIVHSDEYSVTRP